MSDHYMSYNRKMFEHELTTIASKLGLQVGDYTEVQGRQKFEERVYEVTTQNKFVRILIYSSIDPRTNISREVGGDAVRINFYVKHNNKMYYKKFKTHQRIKTLFNNIKKSIESANDMSVGSEIEKWLYAVRKN